MKNVELHAKRILEWLGGLPVSVWQRLVILVLLIWLCHTLAQLFWLLMAQGAASPAADVQSPLPLNVKLAERAPTATASIDVDKIKSLDLFGATGAEAVAQVVAEAEPAIEQDAVDTRLNIALNGVIGSSRQSAARAIITDGQQQALYAPGDLLPAGSNVKLIKVLEDRVIFENAGRYEVLWLYTDEPIAAAPPQRTTRAATGSNRSETKRPRLPPTSIPGEQDRSVSVANMSAKSLDSVIKFSMARKGGQVIGFKIRPGSNRDMFKKLGLKANDIVTSVNGVELDSSAKAMEVYQTMRGATSASLDILRNNEPLSLTVSVDEG